MNIIIIIFIVAQQEKTGPGGEEAYKPPHQKGLGEGAHVAYRLLCNTNSHVQSQGTPLV